MMQNTQPESMSHNCQAAISNSEPPFLSITLLLFSVWLEFQFWNNKYGLNAVQHARTQPQRLQRGVHHKPSEITLIQEEAVDTMKTLQLTLFWHNWQGQSLRRRSSLWPESTEAVCSETSDLEGKDRMCFWLIYSCHFILSHVAFQSFPAHWQEKHKSDDM